MTTLQAFTENFHFLRPWFLLALPAALLVLLHYRKNAATNSNWKQAIDSTLLPHLLDTPQLSNPQRWPAVTLGLAWIIACLAMAGPSWEQLKQPVIKKQDALVLILDLSLSMYAQDQKPSRIIAAQRKIADILARRREGLTALVVYSGDAHVVAPLTEDSATIATLLPALEPNIMPKYGSNLVSAFTQAQALLDQAAIAQAQVVLLTDEISPDQFDSAIPLLKSKVRLAIITFGTNNGAPIPLNQGFWKDKQGNTIIAKLNWDEIADIAASHRLPLAQSSFDDRDLNQVLVENFAEESALETDRQFDLWQDRGHWLVLLLIPLFLLGFRRGWILLPLFFILPEPGHALEWQDLWQTRDQQAAAAFASGDNKTAAEKFVDPQWKASAQYRNGNYAAALEGFAKAATPEALYNQGNALAKLGRYQEAIAAYDAALQQNNDLADARFNKSLLEKLLEQQQQQQQQQQENQQKEQDSASQNNENPQDNGQNQQPQENQQQTGDPQDQQQDQQQESSSQGRQQDNSEKNSTSSSGGDKEPQPESGQQNQQNSAAGQQPKPADAGEDADDKPDGQMPTQAAQTPLEKEQQQALQQWLRKIPDDPGQLLRNKFRYQYEQNRRDNQLLDKESDQPW